MPDNNGDQDLQPRPRVFEFEGSPPEFESRVSKPWLDDDTRGPSAFAKKVMAKKKNGPA